MIIKIFYVVQKDHTVDGEDFSLSAHKNKSQYCSTTGKPTRSFATERVSLDSV
jgi:hypothetical protein